MTFSENKLMSYLKEYWDDQINNQIFYPNLQKLTLDKEVTGKGSFGEIIKALDEKEQNYAVKCCRINEQGIPNIMECYIMSSIIHPYINRGYYIFIQRQHLFILQELALCDLFHHTRKQKNNYRPTVLEMKKWFYSISLAVDVLHQHQIIHADIKSSNILLYNNGRVKLTDFTLSVKQWEDHKYQHYVCTSTHRPLECLLNEIWSYSLDIWSLGCTFYEIAYGELLFPNQKFKDDVKSPDLRYILRKRMINCLLEWGIKETKEKIPLDLFPLPFVNFKFNNNEEHEELDDLIKQTLKILPNNRPTITNILNHQFFANISDLFKPVDYYILSKPTQMVKLNDYKQIINYIKKKTNNERLQKMTYEILRKTNDPQFNKNKILACLSIAIKLSGKPINEYLSISDEVQLEERKIAQELSFRFL